MPGIDFRSARLQVRLAEVLELIGFVPARRCRDQVRGPCPVHRSRAPHRRAFAAHLGRGVWHCFGCGASGNALDLWARLTQQAIYPAVLERYRRLDRTPPRR